MKELFKMTYDSPPYKEIMRTIKELSVFQNKPLKIDKEGEKKSKISFFKGAKNFCDKELGNILVNKIVRKSRYSRRETVSWVYLDLIHAANNLEVNRYYYPKEFGLRWRTIDSKLKFVQSEYDDICIMSISSHCLERIIERSKSGKISEALTVLNEIWPSLLVCAGFLIKSNKPDGRIAAVTKSGYFILAYDPEGHFWTLVTWLPKTQYTEAQHTKFFKLASHLNENIYLFSESVFNNSGLLNETDSTFKIPVLGSGEIITIMGFPIEI
jgi:hypothetical protein